MQSLGNIMKTKVAKICIMLNKKYKWLDTTLKEMDYWQFTTA